MVVDCGWPAARAVLLEAGEDAVERLPRQRLGQVVAGALAHRVHAGLEARMAGQQHEIGGFPQAVVEQLGADAIRKLQVDHADVRAGIEAAARLGQRMRGHRGEAVLLEQAREKLDGRGVVVDDEGVWHCVQGTLLRRSSHCRHQATPSQRRKPTASVSIPPTRGWARAPPLPQVLAPPPAPAHGVPACVLERALRLPTQRLAGEPGVGPHGRDVPGAPGSLSHRDAPAARALERGQHFAHRGAPGGA